MSSKEKKQPFAPEFREKSVIKKGSGLFFSFGSAKRGTLLHFLQDFRALAFEAEHFDSFAMQARQMQNL